MGKSAGTTDGSCITVSLCGDHHHIAGRLRRWCPSPYDHGRPFCLRASGWRQCGGNKDYQRLLCLFQWGTLRKTSSVTSLSRDTASLSTFGSLFVEVLRNIFSYIFSHLSFSQIHWPWCMLKNRLAFLHYVEKAVKNLFSDPPAFR